MDDRQFSRWADRDWPHRGDDYQALKQRIAAGLLDLAEKHLPGLRDSVAFSELASPLSLAHFTGTRSGGCYGLAVSPERLRARWLGVRTPVRGLLMTGSDVASPGVAGAMMGGVLSAASVLGATGMPRIMRAAPSARPAPVAAESEAEVAA